MRILTEKDYPCLANLHDKVVILADSTTAANEILRYDKYSSYIICTEEALYDILRSAQYYCTILIKDSTRMTDASLKLLTSRNWKDYEQEYSYNSLQTEWNKNKDACEALVDLLTAMETGNKEKLVEAINAGVFTLIPSINALKSMLDRKIALQKTQRNFAICENEIATLNQRLKAENSQELLKKIDTLTSDLATLKLREDEYKKQILLDATSIQSSVPLEKFQEANSKAVKFEHYYLEVQNTLEEKTAALLELSKQYDDLKSKEESSHLFDENIPNISTKVAGDYLTLCRNMLPIYSDGTFLPCKHFYYFRETKSIPQLSIFILYLTLIFNQVSQKEAGIKTGIIVYDWLLGDMERTSYTAKRFGINSYNPAMNFPVVTNNLSFRFVSELMQLKDFTDIIIFDRLHLDQPIVNRKSVKTFYFVDSDATIQRLKLKPEECITTGTTNFDKMKYSIPANAAFGSQGIKERTNAMKHLGWVPELFADSLAKTR